MVKLVPPREGQRVLFDRIAQLYAYDFSEMTGGTIGADGLYPSHECFSKMWCDPKRHPRLIMLNTEVVGFAVVHEVGEREFDMEQFFVLRKFRRSGVGRNAAQQLFRTFSGRWTVEQITVNVVAQAFWRSVIAEYTEGQFQDTLGDDPEQSFVSG